MTKQAQITCRNPEDLHEVGLFETCDDGPVDDNCDGSVDENITPDMGAKLIGVISMPDLYAIQEFGSSYAYPNAYKGPKPIANQIKAIAKIFGLDPSQAIEFAKNLPALPEGAEGWFAIPRWEKLGSSYGEAVDRVLAKIASKRKFYNHREGQTGSEYLREHEKTVKAFQTLEGDQNGHDILIVPAQFGLRHRGRSVRQAREVMNAVEFGLGAFAVGSMILMHPEREVEFDQIHIDCAGDEFAPDADGDFSYALLFNFCDDEVGFDADWCNNANGDYGSASGFLPVKAR
jgi:hypothetical protein